jgi:hypothetical protein
MSYTLSNGTTTLTLPKHLLWLNEFDWRPVAMSAPRYSLTGALLLESQLRQAGRPIELGGESSWLTRADLLTLTGWAAVPGLQLSLVIRGEPARAVKFNHAAGAIEAAPVVEFSDPEPGDFYRLVLRFLEV